MTEGSPDTTAYAHGDAQGSTICVTDEDGDVLAAFTYGPYGEQLAQSGTTTLPFRWLGGHGVTDEGDGFYHMKARFYHAGVKRFVTADPIGIAGGGNVYGYGVGNPLVFSDPSGLYQYRTANSGVALVHELNPFNQDGSLNNQVAAGVALLGMRDSITADQLNGLSQLQRSGGSETVQNAYLTSLAVSANAVASTVGAGAVGLTPARLALYEGMGMVQALILGAAPHEMVVAGGASVIAGSAGLGLSGLMPASSLTGNALAGGLANMAGNLYGQGLLNADVNPAAAGIAFFTGSVGGMFGATGPASAARGALVSFGSQATADALGLAYTWGLDLFFGAAQQSRVSPTRKKP